MFKSSRNSIIIAVVLLLIVAFNLTMGAKFSDDVIAEKFRRSNPPIQGSRIQPNLTTTTTATTTPHYQSSNILKQEYIQEQESGFEPDPTTVISSRVKEDMENDDYSPPEKLKGAIKNFARFGGHIQDTSSFSSFGELGAAAQLHQPGRRHNYKINNLYDRTPWLMNEFDQSSENQNYASRYHAPSRETSKNGSPYDKQIAFNQVYNDRPSREHQLPVGYPSSEYPTSDTSNYPTNYDSQYANYNINSAYNPYSPSSQTDHSNASHLNSMAKWSAFHMKKAEVICAAIAIGLGAAIVGAPIYLIYLVLQGAMNGSSGSLSLINAVAPSTSGTSTLRALLRQFQGVKRSSAGAELRNGTALATSHEFLENYIVPLVNHLKRGEILDRFNKAIDKFSKL